MGTNLKGKELGEGISQLKDRRYCARYTTKYGKRKVLYDKDLKQLKKRLEKAKYEERFYNREVINDKMTLNDVYELWVKKKEQTVKESSLAQYLHIYQTYIKNSLGDIHITNIYAGDIENLFYSLYKRLKYVTMHNIKVVLCNIFEFAIRQEVCITNPARHIDVGNKKEEQRRKKRKEQTKYLTEEQRRIFYEYTERKKSKQLPLYKLMMYTGLRIGEAIALTWNDIDFEHRTISVNKTCARYYMNGKKTETYAQSPKTISSERKIPICDMAMQVLQEQKMSEYTSEDLVFLSIRHTPCNENSISMCLKNIITHINQEQKELAEANHTAYTPLPYITPHSFRHTFATMCLEQGVPPKVVQKYLGHSTIQMTMDLYTHVTDDLMFSEIDKLNNSKFKIG